MPSELNIYHIMSLINASMYGVANKFNFMALHKCFEVNFLKEKKTMKNELTHQPGTAHLFYSN